MGQIVNNFCFHWINNNWFFSLKIQKLVFFSKITHPLWVLNGLPLMYGVWVCHTIPLFSKYIYKHKKFLNDLTLMIPSETVVDTTFDDQQSTRFRLLMFDINKNVIWNILVKVKIINIHSSDYNNSQNLT